MLQKYSQWAQGIGLPNPLGKEGFTDGYIQAEHRYPLTRQYFKKLLTDKINLPTYLPEDEVRELPHDKLMHHFCEIMKAQYMAPSCKIIDLKYTVGLKTIFEECAKASKAQCPKTVVLIESDFIGATQSTISNFPVMAITTAAMKLPPNVIKTILMHEMTHTIMPEEHGIKAEFLADKGAAPESHGVGPGIELMAHLYHHIKDIEYDMKGIFSALSTAAQGTKHEQKIDRAIDFFEYKDIHAEYCLTKDGEHYPSFLSRIGALQALELGRMGKDKYTDPQPSQLPLFPEEKWQAYVDSKLKKQRTLTSP